ncbi:MAG TPA: M20/M25/M40 family metallo-hydrolase [Acidobacteriaceae bacterium]|nr:M20/M25/M40 family metallo-hydrolase [Acidobacteriaceae bacterium]
MNSDSRHTMDRREFIHGAAAGAAALAFTRSGFAAEGPDKQAVLAQVPKLHNECVERLQEWIKLPSIAAENRGYPEGPNYMANLAREAGFQHAEVVPTSGKSGVFATLNANAKKTLAVYFMYDVKQFNPAEWSSPPLAAAIVEKPGLGRAVVGRGAVNSKGPESAFLGALRAFRAAKSPLPVNLVLICEGEEEIASPHFPQIVQRADIQAALKKCDGIVIPSAAQALDGTVEVTLGSKGVVELELVSSGEHWGRGPKHDIHSSLEAAVDSPTWRLVKALNTLVGPDGHTPAVEGFGAKALPLTPAQKQMIAVAIKRRSEAETMQQLSIGHWVHDAGWLESQELLESKPTINIEGLVAGYTGPGGKTILPYRAVAKIDMRIVPNMTAAGTLALLKQHLIKQGFPDIEVNMSGGYNPTTTSPDSDLVKAQLAVYRASGIEPILWPRSPGSWPGYIFTEPPLSLAAGQFGLGHGNGAHAPNEYYLIDSTNPKIQGMDGAVRSHIEFLFAMA